VWIYFRRELPIAGRRTLAGLRAATLVIILFLLANPSLPGDGEPLGTTGPWLLVDASLSMTAAVPDTPAAAPDTPAAAPDTPAARTVGRSAWVDALERAVEVSTEDSHVASFGGPWIGPAPGTLERPEQPTSLLGPALDRALESGASEITVVSDMRIADQDVVLRRIAERAVPIRFEAVGPSGGRNAGIGRLQAPPSVSGGDSIPLEFTIISEGVTDSMDVRILEEGQPVRVLRAAPATARRESVLRVAVPAPPESGPVRYTAEVQFAGDMFPLDDRRDVLVEVDPEAGGLVLVSFTSDWEPRFLLPVLQQVTGLTPHGFVALQDGRFLALESGPKGGGIRETDEVRRRVEGAELLVVHGASARVPQWILEAAVAASRVIVFAADAKGPSTFGLRVAPVEGGEWYASTGPTPSVLSGALQETPWSGLPPLTGFLKAEEESVGDAPLRVQLQGSGPADPAMLMTTDGPRRRVTVLTAGYWRWAFRPGAGRVAYRRLWSALGGWLLANEPLSGGPGVRPTQAVSPVGSLQEWRSPTFRGGDLRVKIWAGREGFPSPQGGGGPPGRGDLTGPGDPSGVSGQAPGDAVVDTTVTIPETGVFELPGLPEGDYTYEVVGGDDETAGSGRFLVTSYSPEMGLPVMETAEPSGVEAPEVGESDALKRKGRPMRSHPLPYLVVLVLLCTEWVLRRRRGLR
jgi:hypothetical protein